MKRASLTKAQLRVQVLAARRQVAPAVRAAEAEALSDALVDFVAGRVEPRATVCAYVPIGTEPGSPAMLDALVEARLRVLLPVARTEGGMPQPLQWAQYRPGELAEARFGLLEPTGPQLPAGALTEASVLIVPALALDRHGVRLGRGAGFYDRSLPLRRASTVLIALVRDDEFVDELPADPHDVAMTHAATPSRGIIPIEAS